jgi:hypothetical protein
MAICFFSFKETLSLGIQPQIGHYGHSKQAAVGFLPVKSFQFTIGYFFVAFYGLAVKQIFFFPQKFGFV